ncbi:hypothetical protein AB5I41_26715 [Sphingomonas sp. MMS24-JH45]
MDRRPSDTVARRQAALDERTCRLICPIASAMVGVCLTGIGLLHIGIVGGHRAGFADDLLALEFAPVPGRHAVVVHGDPAARAEPPARDGGSRRCHLHRRHAGAHPRLLRHHLCIEQLEITLRRILLAIAGTVLIAVAGLIGFVAHLGYFGVRCSPPSPPPRPRRFRRPPRCSSRAISWA